MDSMPARQWRLLRTGDDRDQLASVSALVFDIDNTLYHHPEYHAVGTRGEISEIARILGHEYNDMKSMIAERKKYIAARFNRPATMTETVISLGITRQQWNDLRCRAWQPKEWLAIDHEICNMMLYLQGRYTIAFGTNSPIIVGTRVLETIGIMAVMPEAQIFGPESFDVSKPDPKFFVSIARELGVPPPQCLSIGDREEADGTPAILAGYAGALLLPGSRDALIEAASILFNYTRMEMNHA
ncbi:MAG: HAD family hydrolase [bacterium]|nr:HAD family hydrolase [bacterium]MDZ4285768.1 HAD family hydrolase [Candidatus Sungbacteria bacterium]